MSSLFQNSLYIGNAFNGILYGELLPQLHTVFGHVRRMLTLDGWHVTGVEVVLYVQTMQALLRRDTKHPRTNRFFAILSTALLFLITIFVAVQAVFGEEMWIVNANFEGGSAAYLATHASVWYQTMGTTASIVLQLMSDALLVSRVRPGARVNAEQGHALPHVLAKNRFTDAL